MKKKILATLVLAALVPVVLAATLAEHSKRWVLVVNTRWDLIRVMDERGTYTLTNGPAYQDITNRLGSLVVEIKSKGTFTRK